MVLKTTAADVKGLVIAADPKINPNLVDCTSAAVAVFCFHKNWDPRQFKSVVNDCTYRHDADATTSHVHWLFARWCC